MTEAWVINNISELSNKLSSEVEGNVAQIWLAFDTELQPQ